ncbi:hypothetical protein FIBSPDRAFT_685977, partial [Athelia psychrophila]
AYHFGAWENFATVPQISAVSRPKKSKHIKAIDEFSEVISSFLSQKLAALLECHNYSSQLFLAWERVHRFGLYEDHPSLNFNGAFFTIAVKNGSSEIIHVDRNDKKMLWMWIIAVSDWEGGEFRIPKVGVKIPLQTGQVLAVMSGVLAHFSALVTWGRHIIMTCSPERNLV